MANTSRLFGGSSSFKSEPPRLGGPAAIVVFIAMLFAFTIQSDLTTYIQSRLGYRQPYFIFYIAHSSFVFIFPVHLFVLTIATEKPARQYIAELIAVLRNQFSHKQSARNASAFPIKRLSFLLLVMLVGITGPGLLWYAAVSLTSISSVTALWNTNAFWTYVFTVQLTHSRWEKRKLAAVVFACCGVIAIVYGGIDPSGSAGTDTLKSSTSTSFSSQALAKKSPFLGNLLALSASIWYGLFQVIYKISIALPNDPEVSHDALPPDAGEESILEREESIESPRDSSIDFLVPPFGLHPNFLISVIGLLTFTVMALPLPFLHYFGIEKFTLPRDIHVTLAIAMVAFMGLVFNSGFMILLGLWGPIITSVGGLLTIILVLISDVLFVDGFGVLTVWNLLGCCMIVGGFSILALEFRKLV